MKYKSLHDYLDELFAEREPTHEEIVTAKKWYWRQYNRNLKRHQREKKTHVTIGFEKEHAAELTRRLSHNQGLSEYIKHLVVNHLSCNPSQSIHKAPIEQLLFLIRDVLEELVHNPNVIDHSYLKELVQTIDATLESLNT